MKFFLVGGAVRDKLMGVDPKDRDYVVVNGSAEELKKLGLDEVGQKFPIFIHPKTRDEYALARKETLEEDLSHRDLTMNAIAESRDGKLIDPFGGINDIQNKIIRHVVPGFAEDPLRVFRVARFATKYADFTIAPETIELMKEVVQTPEFLQIAPERVFNELKLALSYEQPSRFFKVLKEVGGLRHFFEEIAQLIDVPQNEKYHPEGDAFIHTMLVLDHASILSVDLKVRFSALVHDLGKGATPKKTLPKHIGHEARGIDLVKRISRRLLIPNDWLELALIVTKQHLKVHRLQEMKASTIVDMFYEMDAFRKPYLVNQLALACNADNLGKLRKDYPQGNLLKEYFEVIKVSPHFPSQLQGRAIADEIRLQRIQSLKSHLKP